MKNNAKKSAPDYEGMIYWILVVGMAGVFYVLAQALQSDHRHSTYQIPEPRESKYMRTEWYCQSLTVKNLAA